MALVSNYALIEDYLRDLRWADVTPETVIQWALNESVSPQEVACYLKALVETPLKMNDQTIPNCTGATATKITNFLAQKKRVLT